MLAAISKTVPYSSAAAAAVLIALLILIGKVPLRYTLRNLTVRWRTTLMTALAFTLVVGLFTVMLAFVNGMYRLTDGSGQVGNVIILSDGATDELFSNLPAGDVADIENQPGIMRVEGRPLSSRETYIVVNQPIRNAPPGRPQRRFLQVRGIDDVTIAARVHALTLYPGGKWFSDSGVDSVSDQAAAGAASKTANQCVLGEGIARELARDRSPDELAHARNPARLEVDDTFAIGKQSWRVVGVMQSAGRTLDSEVWAKRSLVGPLFGKDNYTTVIVHTVDAVTAEQVKNFFTLNYKKAAVQAQVETEYFASLAATNQQFLYSILFVTFVMALGGVFGVMNTMFAAVSQRIKDIGVLRLLGFARGQILVAFVMESLLIALIGGVLGVALGSLTDGLSATSVVSAGPGGGKSIVLKLTVDANILTGGLALAMAMGALGGFFPALAAVRLRALEALR
jgi:cell division protein FtsX